MLKGLCTVSILFIFGIIFIAVVMPAQFAVFGAHIKSDIGLLKNIFQEVKGESITYTASDLLQSFTHQNTLIQAETITVDDIIDTTNKERIANGLPPLKKNIKLDASAKLKADDMIAKNYFEHTSPSGKTVSDLGTQVGYDYIVMGENLALGDFANSQELLTAWMNSPGHRANILNSRYQDIGAYAAIGTYEGRQVWFAVQHFGTQKSVCPSVSTKFKTQITDLGSTLASKAKVIQNLKTTLETPGAQDQPNYKIDVENFDALVDAYNKLVANSKQQTIDYNNAVSKFNTCLSEFQ